MYKKAQGWGDKIGRKQVLTVPEANCSEIILGIPFHSLYLVYPAMLKPTWDIRGLLTPTRVQPVPVYRFRCTAWLVRMGSSAGRLAAGALGL